MNKEDLKTGDIIETREGNRYLILEMDNERFNKQLETVALSLLTNIRKT